VEKAKADIRTAREKEREKLRSKKGRGEMLGGSSFKSAPSSYL